MSKKEYLDRLEQLLSDISSEERQAAIEYFTDYLEDAGPDGEQEVMEHLGSPEEVAAAGIGPTAPFLKEELERSRRVQRLQPASPEACTTEADATAPTKRAKKSKKPAAEDTAPKKKSTKTKKES